MTTGPTIGLGTRLAARVMRAGFTLVGSPSKSLRFATQAVADPETVTVPTRHGPVRCLLYRPPTGTGPRPPVHVQLHGGAFIVRSPEQDDHVCRYLASDVGAAVLVPDYDTAPKVAYPVAEHQAYDVAAWAHAHGAEQGWDGGRLSVGGYSAGAKLAINVVQQARDAGAFLPVALAVGYGVTDVGLDPHARTSPKRRPAIGPRLLRLVQHVYFPDPATRAEPLASPALAPDLAGFPPTLVTTGGLDSLEADGRIFAEKLRATGADVTYHCFPDVDHGYTHKRPVETAREAITGLGDHLARAYAAANPEKPG
ncbi:esterase/lipase [Frankia torreyi]|uniref:Esterase/lipase n=1 Tax=Frankia torreyi TaxID=1856 RepID=A0A0D8BL95_9ACTN|nr:MULTISPECIES: alpha/beta hydrolase [Frankia]KJE24880.1 esterase/lipase [Frankia torreyi]KQM06950.1 esterase/lipase [Frankia sp. CpI1-P]